MESNLLELSNTKYKVANEILRSTGVVETFSKLGTVEIVGSVKLNLMFRNDIDLLVIADEISREKAIAVTTELLHNPQFQTVGFADYQSHHEEGYTNGYYWELIVIHENESWKFDIWYSTPNEEYIKDVLAITPRFLDLLEKNPEKRELILKIKNEYSDGIKYRNNVNSIDIYKAVLDYNVSTVGQFQDHITNLFA
ncbi:hypothetical protein HYV12_03215 [Candidatus Dojkabacteria bacterium]|nr:hypothetical protein [Candidatus Dojkabacteria bacterium]